MAGFEVTPYGRFCLTSEAEEGSVRGVRGRCERPQYPGPV
jgi:hypothetical protein